MIHVVIIEFLIVILDEKLQKTTETKVEFSTVFPILTDHHFVEQLYYSNGHHVMPKECVKRGGRYHIHSNSSALGVSKTQRWCTNYELKISPQIHAFLIIKIIDFTYFHVPGA